MKYLSMGFKNHPIKEFSSDIYQSFDPKFWHATDIIPYNTFLKNKQLILKLPPLITEPVANMTRPVYWPLWQEMYRVFHKTVHVQTY